MGGQVILGNNKSCNVEGTGSMKFKLHNGTEKVIYGIKYVSELRRKLISLGVLEKTGCIAEKGVLKVTKEALNIMKGFKKMVCVYSLALQ